MKKRYILLFTLLTTLLVSNIHASNMLYFLDANYELYRADADNGGASTRVLTSAQLGAGVRIHMAISGKYAYMVNESTSSITRVDLGTLTVDQAFSTGGYNGPRGIAISGSYAYIGNWTGNSITRMSLADGSTTHNFATGLNAPYDITIIGNTGYAVSFNDVNIFSFDITAVGAATATGWADGNNSRSISDNETILYVNDGTSIDSLTTTGTVTNSVCTHTNIVKSLLSYNGNIYAGDTVSTGIFKCGVPYITASNTVHGMDIVINNTPTGVPTISGTLVETFTLDTNTSTIADADGLGTFTYQWTANNVNIAGATSSTYALTSNEVGKTIKVKVSYIDGQGTPETVISTATTAIVALVLEDYTPGIDGSSTGDGNGDTIADSTQTYVESKTFTIGTTTYWTTAASPTVAATITVTQSSVVSSLLPSNVLSPYGKFAVDITGLAVGEDQTISLFIPYNNNIRKTYKLNRVTGKYDLYPSTITHYPIDNKTKIVYTVISDGNYDKNFADSTVIEDPIVPAINLTQTPISQAATVFLGLLFMSLSLWTLHRKRTNNILIKF